MKAHRPDDRERAPRGRPVAPVRRPEAEQLLRLNRLAGNAAVVSLVVQRFELSEADRQRIKKLKDKKLAAKVKARIKAFTDGQGGLWNMLTGFPVGTKVPESERNEYFAALYRELGLGTPFDALFDIRARLDRKYGETLALEKPGKQEVAPRFVPPGGVGFAPSLDSVTTGRANLVKHVEEKKKPPAVWTTFPEVVRRQLMEMWDKWQKGEADAGSFYEKVYKRSALKQGMDVPSAGEYVHALDAQGLRGDKSEALVKDSPTGYPLELANKGGPPRSRVYLNPHPRHVADVYRFVKDHVHPLPGVIWVKLADHALATTARDVIVIYLSSAPQHAGAEQAVVGLLAGYQRTHVGHFLPEVPHLTRAPLPGVGIGDEPPGDLTAMVDKQFLAMSSEELQKHERADIGFSFSTYRSTLIVRAIEDAGGRVDRFQSLVADYFARAGIDPADPARQGPPDPSALPLLGMIWEADGEEKEKEHS